MITTSRSAFVPRPRSILAASLVAVHLIAAVPSSAWAQGAPPAAPSEADTKKAIELYKKGQSLEKSKKYAEALAAFRESFALVQSPNSRIYIARCLGGTGDYVAAYLEFEAVIADIDARQEAKYQPTRDAAVQERDEAAGKIAMVTVSVANATPETRVSLGLKEVPREQWGKPMPMQPGTVEVSLSNPPAAPQTQTIEITAGQKRAIDLDVKGASGGQVEPPPPTGNRLKSLRPVAYAAGGVGVVGIGMFAVAGALANVTYSDLDTKCAAGTGMRSCPSSAQGQIDEGKVQKDVANVGLVIGAIGLATGVTLFILSRDSGKKDEPKTEVQGVVGPSYLGVQGTF
jgi:hypothetical protein